MRASQTGYSTDKRLVVSDRIQKCRFSRRQVAWQIVGAVVRFCSIHGMQLWYTQQANFGSGKTRLQFVRCHFYFKLDEWFLLRNHVTQYAAGIMRSKSVTCTYFCEQSCQICRMLLTLLVILIHYILRYRK